MSARRGEGTEDEREKRRKEAEATGKKWSDEEDSERLREEIEKKDKIRAAVQEKRRHELSRNAHLKGEL